MQTLTPTDARTNDQPPHILHCLQ